MPKYVILTDFLDFRVFLSILAEPQLSSNQLKGNKPMIEQSFYDNINVLECVEREGIKIEILQYKNLRGLRDSRLAENLYKYPNCRLKLNFRQVFTLTNAALLKKRLEN
jgi:hypothetical protein